MSSDDKNNSQPPRAVITGYSGRFPDCDDIREFLDRLQRKVDLVSKSRRYPVGYHGLPDRAGHLKNIDVFDSLFFNFNKAQIDGLDPQIRLLLECAVEAIMDAKLSMEELSGSRTGVYVGCCFSDYHTWILNRNPDKINGYENVGSANSMAANKISYFLNLRGPSMSIDTACSSSLVALDRAVKDLEAGVIDRALVGGISLNLRPFLSVAFMKYNMLSPTGTCRSFSDDADGYCRSEASCIVVLERSDLCPNKGYAIVKGSGVNSDGYTPEGITFPSEQQQASLAQEVLQRYLITPDSVEFIEAHGTGTIAGDNVEINALDKAYGRADRCINLGSIKSATGHAEGCSGMLALIKALMCFETGQILPNLHYKGTTHRPILEGRFKVVEELTPFNSGDIVISNFGFGGTSAHIILGRGGYSYVSKKDDSSTVYTYGRNTSTLPLERPLSYKNLKAYAARGIVVNGILVASNVLKTTSSPKICWLISGQGSNWLNMGKDLLSFDREFELRLVELGNYINTDLVDLFKDGSKWLSKQFSTIGICVMEIYMIDLLRKKGYSFDYVMGHSMGEICAGYADGAITAEQAVKIGKVRSDLARTIKKEFDLVKVLKSSNDFSVVNGDKTKFEKCLETASYAVYYIPSSQRQAYEHLNPVNMDGLMTVVGAPVDVVQPIISKYPNSVIACYNSPSGLTLSGPRVEIEKVVEEILGVNPDTFVRSIDTDGVAYHSPAFEPFRESIAASIESIIPNPVERSAKWLSTSNGPCLCSAEYHTNNIVNSVFLYDQVLKLPQDTVVIEVGPSNSLLTQVKKTRADLSLVSTLQRNVKESKAIEQMMNQFWLNNIFPYSADGKNTFVANLELPEDQQLVFNQRHHYSWDHSDKFYIPSYKDFETNSEIKISYSLDKEFAFLKDHVIDGRELFPATGHVFTIWKHFGLSNSIRITDMKIIKAVNINDISEVVFTIEKEDNNVGIYQAGEKVASAVVEVLGQEKCCVNTVRAMELDGDVKDFIDATSLYNAFDRYGYEYKNTFRLIERQSIDSSLSRLLHPVHYIAYFDNLLQCALRDVDCLELPTSIKELLICPPASASLLSDPSLSISDVGLDAQFNRFTNTVTTKNVVIRGLHTSPAPVNKNDVLTNRVAKRVKLGHNSVEDQELSEYTLSVKRVVSTSLRSLCSTKPSILQECPWLAKVLRLADKYSDCNEALVESLNVPAKIFHKMVYDTIGTPDKLEEFIKNPFLQMSLHPLHGKFYSDDRLGACNPDWLVNTLGVVRNEVPRQRILEVGTGTGGLTRRLMKILGDTVVSYSPTDVSSIHIEDLEKDPRVKSFRYDVNKKFTEKIDQKYNLAVMHNSIHTASSLKNALRNVLEVLSDDGFILLEEFISDICCFFWGLDKFIWNTPVETTRSYGLWLSLSDWKDVLRDLNLEVVLQYSNSEQTLMLLSRSSTKKSRVVNISSTSSTSSSSAITDLKDALKLYPDERIHIVDSDRNSGCFGLVKTLVKEGYDVVAHHVPSDAPISQNIDTKTQSRFKMYDHHAAAYTIISIESPSSSNDCCSKSEEVDPNGSNYRLMIAKPGDLSTLVWEKYLRQPVTVAFAALNFKDVMYSFGKLKLKVPSFGLEYSGYLGNNPDDRSSWVMGFATKGCIARQVEESLMWNVPENFTLEQASTIPVVYSTIYYALFEKAKLRRGQTVLIHAGAGGVGHAAIHVCIKRGIKVFTTCSSKKREYLMQTFNLEESQICDSRSTSFRDQILNETGGEGVDCVLNSLSGEMLDASLDVLKPFGNFCEIGKFDLMNDTKIGIRCFTQNVSYHAIDLTPMIEDESHRAVLRKLVQDGLDAQEIVPLPCTSYDSLQIEEALRFMSSSNHTGKVVIRMVDDFFRDVPPPSTTSNKIISMKYRFITTGTHVIIGGVGGFGLELAHWLTSCGATRIVLTSRAGIKDGFQRRRFLALQQRLGASDVIISNLNVVDKAQCRELIDTYMADLKGVWHVAMVLQDSLFENMTESKWNNCVDIKKKAFENLDEITQELKIRLDMFCGFSSISSLFGNAGQSNYSYGNNAMETLILNRRSKFPNEKSCVIQWGAIGNVGFVSKTIGLQNVDTMDVEIQNIDVSLSNIHDIIGSNAPVVSSFLKKKQQLNQKNVNFRGWLLNLLGVSEEKCVIAKNEMTLSKLGMDSLQSVEVKVKLSKYGIEKTSKEIGNVKLSEIWDL